MKNIGKEVARKRRIWPEEIRNLKKIEENKSCLTACPVLVGLI
jgi:hypothetical protein